MSGCFYRVGDGGGSIRFTDITRALCPLGVALSRSLAFAGLIWLLPQRSSGACARGRTMADSRASSKQTVLGFVVWGTELKCVFQALSKASRSRLTAWDSHTSMSFLPTGMITMVCVYFRLSCSYFVCGLINYSYLCAIYSRHGGDCARFQLLHRERMGMHDNCLPPRG